MEINLQNIQLLNLNYSKLLSTVARSESLFASVNTRLSALNNSVENFNNTSDITDPPPRKEVTEEDIRKYLDSRSDFSKASDWIAKVAIGYMIENVMADAGAAVGTMIFPGVGSVSGAVVGGIAGTLAAIFSASVYDEIQKYFVKQTLDEKYNPTDKSKYKYPRLPIVKDEGEKFMWPHKLMDQKTYEAELKKYMANNRKDKNNKVYRKNKKVRKPPKPKTTPDEDFGDEFINNLYNQIKTALELKGAKFDKSKLLTEVIDFKNQYAEALGQEIDYKKEIGILQDKLNSLTGEDAETLKERVELQEKLNELNEKDFKNKLQTRLSGFTVKSLDNIADELYGNTTEDYETQGRNYSVPSDHYKKRPPRGQRAGGPPEEEKDGARVSDAYGTNRNAAKLAKGQDPYKVFEQAYGEARKLGGSLNTIMRNLHIVAEIYVGKEIIVD